MNTSLLSGGTAALHVAGAVATTAFHRTSDRNAKENFIPVSASAVLDKLITLPTAKWSFRELPGATHAGPTAHDFDATFGLGGSDTSDWHGWTPTAWRWLA